MSEHTPTPWEIDDDGTVVYLWVDAVKDYVGMTSDYGWGAPHKANAEFIVKAVNNHDALVKALTEIVEGRGAFSNDRFLHACNTIADMKQIAQDALDAVGGSDPKDRNTP